MDHGELYLRPKWSRKLKIMAKRASRILKLEENLEATKTSQVEKMLPVFISMEPSGKGNRHSDL